jgi:hypothetical protein
MIGGRGGTRTRDFLLAKQVLWQTQLNARRGAIIIFSIEQEELLQLL